MPQRPMKEVVMDVLRSAGADKSRSAKMDQDDFLKLLNAFNVAGIHFT